MSEDLKKTLPRIRTFAQDLERQRAKSGQPLPDDVTVPVAVSKPAPTIAPIALMKEEAPQEATTHIPAFHELQKKNVSSAAAKPSTTIPKAPVILKGPTITVGNSAPITTPTPKKIKVRAQKREVVGQKKIVGGGTVITDTRKGDFKLLPSILHSLDRWVASVGKMFKPKKAPTYSIAATDRRKGVIQKATTKTATIFTADNETLKEEIRRRQLTHSTRHDPHDGKSEILWSPQTESGYALLQSETKNQLPTPPIKTEAVTVEFKKRAIPTAPVIVEPTTPIVIAEIQPEPTPTYVAPIVEQPAPVVQKEVVPEIEPQQEEFDEVPVLSEIDVEEPVEKMVEPGLAENRRVFGRITLSNLNTNTLAIGLVGTIACFILVIVAVRTAVDILMPKTHTEIVAASAQPIIKNASISDVTLMPVTSEALLTELYSAVTVSSEVQEIRFVDGDGVAVPAKQLLNLMAFKTDPNFNQSVTEIHVAIVHSNRALVFTVSDSTTALGALLAWESTMMSDISPILGISNTEPTLSFVDQVYKNTDIRILKANDQPILVYGFINKNTVVIAKDTASFATLFGE